ncbi:hypothetical protein GCM10010400_61620 [Streptomyces aculeolatus]
MADGHARCDLAGADRSPVRRGRLPLPPVPRPADAAGGRSGARGVGRSGTKVHGPGWHPRAVPQAPVLEAPVVTSLTEAEREELSRQVKDANKRSEDDVRARGRG